MSMPRFPSAVNIRPTQASGRVISELRLSVMDVIQVVRDAANSWPGYKNDQWWIRGKTPDGRTLKLLVENVHAGLAVIKKVHELKED